MHHHERHHEPDRRSERLVRLISDGGGLVQPLAHLGSHGRGDRPRLLEGRPRRLGQGGLEALENHGFQRNGAIVEGEEALLDAARHGAALADTLVEQGAEFTPAHLGPLEGEHAETDADIDGFGDPAADLLGDVVDVRHAASVGGERRFAAPRPE
ncbi:MAG: hypothetical protein QOD72_1529 [Acidimicrobiaceae bacterium]|nr:hypothetical protein [Acidimicrobiaceae bacterium]